MFREKIKGSLSDKNLYSSSQILHPTLIFTHNKRPMGHIAHLRKQFKSLNTYDYIITLIKRRKKNIINIGSLFEET